jgi:hypothetical protein
LNYEPLIGRDFDAIPAAAHAYLESHPPEDLWVSVTRFAVLAYAPSQHAKRAVMACLAAWDVRDELGERFVPMVLECARYAAEARQPWSEPPILDPPEPSSGTLDELRAAMAEGDLVRAERWLSARLDDADDALRPVVHGDAKLMLNTASALEPLLGGKGRYALLRMPVWELIAQPDSTDEDLPLETLIARAVESRGAVDAVRAVFVALGGGEPAGASGGLKPAAPPLVPYRLARDYAQTLLAHALVPEPELLRAVHHNLEHGESYADWSFA